MVSRRLMPPSSISGIDSASRNRSAWSQEVRLLERVLLEEPLAAHPHPEPHRHRHRGRELADRRVAAEEVHRVHQRAAAAQLQGVEGAVGLQQPREVERLLAASDPPRNPSSRLTLAVTATSPPTSSRTARATWRASRARFSSDPAQRSLRRLSAGRQEAGDQVAVRHVQLEHVEPGADQRARRVDVRRGDAGQVLLGGGADHLHRQRARHPAGADRVHAVGAAVGDRPGVPDLAGDGGAGLVDRVGQPAQAGAGCPRRPRSARRASAPPARPRGRRPWSARPRPRSTARW